MFCSVPNQHTTLEWGCMDVVTTSKHDNVVIITSMWRRVPAGLTICYLSLTIEHPNYENWSLKKKKLCQQTLPAHDVRTTLLRRRFDILTSVQRPYTVFLTSCAGWDNTHEPTKVWIYHLNRIRRCLVCWRLICKPNSGHHPCVMTTLPPCAYCWT